MNNFKIILVCSLLIVVFCSMGNTKVFSGSTNANYFYYGYSDYYDYTDHNNNMYYGIPIEEVWQRQQILRNNASRINCSQKKDVKIKSISKELDSFYLTTGEKYYIIKVKDNLLQRKYIYSADFKSLYPNYAAAFVYKDVDTGYCKLNIPDYNVDSLVMYGR